MMKSCLVERNALLNDNKVSSLLMGTVANALQAIVAVTFRGNDHHPNHQSLQYSLVSGLPFRGRRIKSRHLLIGLLLCLLLLAWLSFFHTTNHKKIHIEPPFQGILQANEQLLVLEPQLLSQLISEDELVDLQWRFDLPPKFEFTQGSLTLGVFADRFEELNLHEFKLVAEVSTENRYSISLALHRFYQCTPSHFSTFTLHLHLVILHRRRHFLWIGSINHNETDHLSEQNIWFSPHFGDHQEHIFDAFSPKLSPSGYSFHIPDDVKHFVSQLPTSRYIRCPAMRRNRWNRRYPTDQKERYIKQLSTEKAIIGMKALMRQQRMQFWLVSGTLLGWHRQCDVISYTSDTDFATRSRYLERNMGKAMDGSLASGNSSIRLTQRFGHPEDSLEYSFELRPNKELLHEKIDLFFVYRNSTHYLQPLHVPQSSVYTHQTYPPYQLCSVNLLGYKMLAPCTPELVIRAEYGPGWMLPITVWHYSRSPLNIGNWMVWKRSEDQHQYIM